ncbi:hypothetical protein [Acinetobacter silvestris]|uniref:Uncharacterized protein n=1 Tax=Acinetobacter silvestris TaxID=1977882 RepID=A0A1Y3CK16_9GAMM|nr:hypothetical protein [Acinetobacter silvestris]OTG65483.1 hypothetical protein B9T28_08465 [Acinetobacter silvestris]
MKIIKQILSSTCILLLCSFTFANDSITTQNTAETIYDIFPGTIIIKNKQLVLYRCTSSGYQYPLHFNHMKDEQRIRELIKLYPKFWLTLNANPFEEKGRYRLAVEAIADEHLGESCHLNDALPPLES